MPIKTFFPSGMTEIKIPPRVRHYQGGRLGWNDERLLLYFYPFPMHPFLTQLFQNLSSIGIDLTGLTIDHIAYRASTIEEGDQLQRDWMSDGVLVKAAQINGREVDIFQFSNPLEFE
jgi:hypothetical protein